MIDKNNINSVRMNTDNFSVCHVLTDKFYAVYYAVNGDFVLSGKFSEFHLSFIVNQPV